MKQLFSYLVIVGLMVSLTACGGGGDSTKVIKESGAGADANDTGVGADTNDNLPAEFPAGKYGEINVTADYVFPEDALFLDVRNDYERYEKDVHGGRHAKGSVAGAIYEFRPSPKRVNENFISDVLSHPDVNNDRSRYIILICNSSSRTKKAAEWLSTPTNEKWRTYDGGGFTTIDMINSSKATTIICSPFFIGWSR